MKYCGGKHLYKKIKSSLYIKRIDSAIEKVDLCNSMSYCLPPNLVKRNISFFVVSRENELSDM